MAQLPLIETDSDLIPVLRGASDEMLQPLVNYITDKGAGRLASKLDGLDVFKANPTRPSMYPDEIASEIQTFGANSIVSTFRGGKGVTYAEIVHDVAGKLKVARTKTMDAAYVEQQILLQVLSQAWNKMTDEERRELLDTLGIDYRAGLPSVLPLVAIQAGLELGGFMAYRIALIVANAVARALLGRGLSLGANAALMRVLGALAGPVGWAVTGIWTAVDVASPAYRVTIPCVVQVAAIRQEQAAQAAIRRCGQGHENPRNAAFCNTCGERMPPEPPPKPPPEPVPSADTKTAEEPAPPFSPYD